MKIRFLGALLAAGSLFAYIGGCSSIIRLGDSKSDEPANYTQQVDTLLDTSFGEGGAAKYTGYTADEDIYPRAYDVAIDTSGNIVVVGTDWSWLFRSGGWNMMIWRYLPNGVLDTTFSGDGFDSFTREPYVKIYGKGVALDADGSIFVTGCFHYKMAIWKYTPAGELDPGFGDGGLVTYTGADVDSEGNDIELDPSGNIIVAGNIGQVSGALSSMALWRYKPDGQIDTAFGTDGFSILIGYREDEPTSFYKLHICDSGDIIASGSSLIARYNSTGVIDASFGRNGSAFFEGEEGYGLAVDADGTIYVAGQTQTDPWKLGIWSFLPNGGVNTTFGSGGVVTYDVDNTVANAITIAPDGKLLTTGSVGWPDQKGLFLRFLKYGALDTCGDATCSYGGDTVRGTFMAITSDGKIITDDTGIESYESGIRAYGILVRLNNP